MEATPSPLLLTRLVIRARGLPSLAPTMVSPPSPKDEKSWRALETQQSSSSLQAVPREEAG